VFVGLRTGLHVLVAGLALFVVAQAWSAGRPSAVAITLVAAAFLVVYAAGFVTRADRNRIRFWSRIWVAALSVLWMALIWLTPEAAYLAFPLFFLSLEVMPGWRGPPWWRSWAAAGPAAGPPAASSARSSARRWRS
jgi:FtsH-binding integral membrane protein